LNLLALAIIPGIILLIYIYKKDKREKEPLGLLLICLLGGLLSCIPAIIFEAIFSSDTHYSYLDLMLECIFVIGLAEEGSKFLFLSMFTWKNNNFDYYFDGIVYSVYVSLGFAIPENILYVFQHGAAVGIFRAFSAVPGHMAFAVIMGYFYSKMKAAKITGKGSVFGNFVCAILVPAVVHGLYDTFAFGGMLAAFFIFVIVMYIFIIKLINKSSRNDKPFVQMRFLASEHPGSWYCTSCGKLNEKNFCISCGSPKSI